MTALRSVVKAWRWLTRVPTWLKVGATTLTVGASLYGGWLHTVHRIEQRAIDRVYARADSLRTSSLDSLRRALVDSLRRTSTVATKQDSVVQRSITKVREKVRTLPPAVATVPEVRGLTDASLELADNAALMRETLRKMTGLTERFVYADSVQIQTLTVTVVQYQDRVIQLEKRPSRLKTALVSVGAAAIGFVVGAFAK